MTTRPADIGDFEEIPAAPVRPGSLAARAAARNAEPAYLHSLNAELAGLKSGFSILDTDDQIRLIKQIIEAHDLDEKRWPARQLASLIDGWKNRGLTPAKLPAGEAHAFASGKGGELYAEYQQRLKVVNAADFGDLLLEVLRIFQEYPDI